MFSAGNWDEDPAGQTQWAKSPGNAKNVISVGAAQGWAEGRTSAHVDCTYDPLAPHLIRNIAGGVISETWHSRRGYHNESGSVLELPRFKPDLVAPGSLVAAARSQNSSDDDIYQCFSGTSAAAPAVTGAAVLAEAWYFYKISGETALPSPAMLKAMLVAHADSLADGTDYWPPAATLPHSPSAAQGWGRINLDKLFQDTVSVAVFDQDHEENNPERRFTSTGQYWHTQLQIDNPDEDIIVVMAYTDAHSNAGASSLRVNDLNLNVTKIGMEPGTSHFFHGNYFESNSWYSDDTAGQILLNPPQDRNNTVEVVRIPAGYLSGSFIVKVRATAIQAKAVPGFDEHFLNQDFALYVYNAQ